MITIFLFVYSLCKDYKMYKKLYALKKGKIKPKTYRQYYNDIEKMNSLIDEYFS